MGVAVVTGAGNGIGRELAIEIAGRGAPVALVDVDEAGLAETTTRCRAAGGRSCEWVLDVAAPGALDDLGAEVVNRLGEPESLFNVAGVIHVGPLGASSMRDVRRVIDTNLLGVMATSHALLPHISQGAAGLIVNVSSAFGLIGVGGYTAYAASKFAIRGFSDALRQEVSFGPRPVQVSCAHLGGVSTGIMRRGTYANPADAGRVQARFDRLAARTTPREAAVGILAGADKGRAEYSVGADAHLVRALSHLPGPVVRGLVRRRFS